MGLLGIAKIMMENIQNDAIACFLVLQGSGDRVEFTQLLASVEPSSTLNFCNLLARFFWGRMIRKEVFAISAWLLWNRRNASHFGRQVHPIANIISMAGNMLQEFLIAEDKEPVKPLPPISHQWRPPELNQYKVNFDAAVFRTTNSAGIGVIVRDWRGELVGALWLTPSLIWRLWLAGELLSLLLSLGFKQLFLKGIQLWLSML